MRCVEKMERAKLRNIALLAAAGVLLLAGVLLYPFARNAVYDRGTVKAFQALEAELLRKAVIPDEMRLPVDLIRKTAEEFDGESFDGLRAETENSAQLMQLFSDAALAAHVAEYCDNSNSYLTRRVTGDGVSLYIFYKMNLYWDYFSDGTIEKEMIHLVMEKSWLSGKQYSIGKIVVTNHNNESILVSVRGDNHIQMRGDKVYVRPDLLRYDIPCADLRAFLDAYDSGALPEGTMLTFEALEQYCERQQSEAEVRK